MIEKFENYESIVVSTSRSLPSHYFILMSPVVNRNIFARAQPWSSFVVAESLHFAPFSFLSWFTLVGLHFFRIVTGHVGCFWKFLLLLAFMFFPPFFGLVPFDTMRTARLRLHYITITLCLVLYFPTPGVCVASYCTASKYVILSAWLVFRLDIAFLYASCYLTDFCSL